jgi:hypothetical protein
MDKGLFLLYLQIAPLEDGDDRDFTSDTHHSLMGTMGTIAFRTCFRSVRFPPAHVARLALAHYSPGTEPTSFSKALHHWLLVEILGAIGSHTIA